MATKKQLLAQEVAKAVGAGKTVALETVDFNDPNRPKTCLEVDFPILPVNQVAIIEGNAGKPIYQMSKFPFPPLLSEEKNKNLPSAVQNGCLLLCPCSFIDTRS